MYLTNLLKAGTLASGHAHWHGNGGEMNMRTKPSSQVIVALDHSNERDALDLASQLPPGSIVKVGKELHTAVPGIVRTLIEIYHLRVFLDLKFKDIPNTVAGACRAAAEQGVWMMNLHADGGSRMMQAAVEALAQFGEDRPLLVGVTVLTSMEEPDLEEVGVNATPAEQVLLLASLAYKCGLDGVVCSPLEVEMLRATLSDDFVLVTPGIRSAGAPPDDQRRTMSAEEAIDAGSDYLVVGRPIIKAVDPFAAYQSMNETVQRAVTLREIRR